MEGRGQGSGEERGREDGFTVVMIMTRGISTVQGYVDVILHVF